jgi:hypothetical protein
MDLFSVPFYLGDGSNDSMLFDVSSGEIDFPSMMRKEPGGIRPGVSSEVDEFISDLS